MDPRVPFRQRSSSDGTEWHVLIEGVPTHLQASLKQLILERLHHDQEMRGILHRRLRLNTSQIPTASGFIDLAERDLGLYLEIVDFLAQEAILAAKRFERGMSSRYDMETAAGLVIELRKIFEESNSAFQFEEHEGTWLLTRRVDQTVTDALRDAIAINPDAGALLQEAWFFCFQRAPNHKAAYDRAILAVESVASKLFIPRDPSPTLGKAIAHLQSTVGNWSVAGLDSAKQNSSETLLAMLKTMWTAQGRHVERGGVAPSATTREEAESIVFLAISIVQLFSRGLIAKI